jgi:hypothetical protein
MSASAEPLAPIPADDTKVPHLDEAGFPQRVRAPRALQGQACFKVINARPQGFNCGQVVVANMCVALGAPVHLGIAR